MEKIIQNDFLKVSWDQPSALLSVEWSSKTEAMSDKEYKDLLMTISGFILKNNIKKWLGDTKEFAFAISPTLQEWTSQEFNKRLLDGGLEKMALIIPTEFFANLAVQQTIDEMQQTNHEKSFETRYFDNINDAISWLN